MDNAIAWFMLLCTFIVVLAACGAIADWLDSLPRNDTKRRRQWTPDQRSSQDRFRRSHSR